MTSRAVASALLAALAWTVAAAQSADPLPSWNAGKTKQSIVDFVAAVTRPGPQFVPAAERIATFDNDGTLWAEMPLYFQVMFAMDRAKALAPSHPEWKDTEPFKSAVAGDMKTALAAGTKALLVLMGATHAGMTSEEFDRVARDWFATARHPATGQPYTQMVYQPMLELLAYLRANGFKTYIVSGGGVDFMRAFSERVYGIPPEQVIGSTGELKFEMRNGVPTMHKLAALDFFDDKEAKAVAIQRHIGRRPIAAFGNSDGDLQMLQWACAGPGARYCLFVRHTDGEREYAYDKSPMGVLDAGLKEAAAKGWTVADMKNDWNTIYPFQKK
jgi:phosphoglycolate phosphatase-like HAD superfamily hydrolase